MRKKSPPISLTQKSQKGFTLIELVVVIVILGILAVTAAPKFIDLQEDARTATLNAVKASMQSASTIVHSKSLIAGNEATATSTVVVNGVSEPIALGYPRSNDAAAATSWGNLLDVDDFTIASSQDKATTKIVIIYPTTAPVLTDWTIDDEPTAAANCFSYYSEVTVAGNLPVIETVNCI